MRRSVVISACVVGVLGLVAVLWAAGRAGRPSGAKPTLERCLQDALAKRSHESIEWLLIVAFDNILKEEHVEESKAAIERLVASLRTDWKDPNHVPGQIGQPAEGYGWGGVEFVLKAVGRGLDRTPHARDLFMRLKPENPHRQDPWEAGAFELGLSPASDAIAGTSPRFDGFVCAGMVWLDGDRLIARVTEGGTVRVVRADDLSAVASTTIPGKAVSAILRGPGDRSFYVFRGGGIELVHMDAIGEFRVEGPYEWPTRAYSPSACFDRTTGTMFVAASSDVQSADAPTMEWRRRFGWERQPYRLLTAGGGVVFYVDGRGGLCRYENDVTLCEEGRRAQSLAFAGGEILTSGDRITVQDAKTLAVVESVDAAGWEGGGEGVFVTEDGAWFAYGSRGTVVVGRVKPLVLAVRLFGHRDGKIRGAWSKDGAYLATVDAGGMLVKWSRERMGLGR